MIDHDNDKSPLLFSTSVSSLQHAPELYLCPAAQQNHSSVPSCRQAQNLLRHHKLQGWRRLFYILSLLSLQETTYLLLNGPPSNLPFGYQKAVVFLSHLPHAAPSWWLLHGWVPILEKKTSSRFKGLWERR